MLIFDLETNGLLHDLTSIHCLAIYDTNNDETHVFNDVGTKEPITRGITMLEEADRIAGHNIISFDIPAIQKLYGFFKPPDVVDTLILSRLFHPDMLALDKKNQPKHMPVQLYGRHSLESYGYRLHEYKGSFSKDTDWKDWSQEMEDYCVQDVVVTTKLCKHFHPYLTGAR
jgi:DNA polymerase-1